MQNLTVAQRPLAIINCDVLAPDALIRQGLILVHEGSIKALGRSHEVPLPAEVRLLDARGGLLAPGLLDLGRPILADETPEAGGVTAYLASVHVAAPEDLPALAAAAVTRSPHGSRFLGLHLVASWPPDGPVCWEDVYALAAGRVRLVTVANEDPATARQALAAGLPVALPADVHHPVLRGLLAGGAAVGWLPGPTALPAVKPALVTPPTLRQMEAPAAVTLMSGDGELLSAPLLRDLARSTGYDLDRVAQWATRQPADLLGLPYGRLEAGAPADLICWTRYGELAWTLVAGAVAHPPLPPADVVAWLAALLGRRPETISVADVRQDAGHRDSGIDLVWRFRRAGGREETTSFVVCQDADPACDHFHFDLSGAHPTGLAGSRAHWCLYLFTAAPALYALPVGPVRRWLQSAAGPGATGKGEVAAPIPELLAAVPRAHRTALPPD